MAAPRGKHTRWAALFLLALAACPVEPAEEEVVRPEAPGAITYLQELGPPVISRVTMDDGVAGTVLALESETFAYDVELHPAEQSLAMAYTPPPADTEGYDRSQIASWSESAGIARIACEDVPEVFCYYPVWSADAERIWYVESGEHLSEDYDYILAYTTVATGESVRVQPWATEPAMNTDGTQMLWVQSNEITKERSLVLADSDGTEIRVLVAEGAVIDIGIPFFSTDGEYAYFVVLESVVATWMDLIWPKAMAHASHSTAGTWWRVPVAGGALERVTAEPAVHHDGTAGPDGIWFASATSEGVAQINIATGESFLVVADRSVRALTWGPR